MVNRYISLRGLCCTSVTPFQLGGFQKWIADLFGEGRDRDGLNYPQSFVWFAFINCRPLFVCHLFKNFRALDVAKFHTKTSKGPAIWVSDIGVPSTAV